MGPEEFARFHVPALERNEARHNKILPVLGRMAAGQGAGVATWTLGGPGACAVRSADGVILLGDLSEDECRALAEQTADADYRGVVGPDRTALAFAARAAELGTAFAEHIPQRILSLTERPPESRVRGEARPSTAEDSDVIAVWLGAFFAEAAPHDPPPARERLAAAAATGRHILWVVDGRPVATAAIIRRTRNAAAISLVYTSPTERGKGYGGAVTAAVAGRAFTEGKSIACLYTDLRNPMSNRCYARIGFRPVCDAFHVPRSTVAMPPS